MNRWIRTMALAVGVLFWVASVRAQTVEPGGLTIRGFLSASTFLQDQNFAFGNGQNAEWPVAPELLRNSSLYKIRFQWIFNTMRRFLA